MNKPPGICSFSLAVIVLLFADGSVAWPATTTKKGEEVVPLIVIEDVRLTDAIFHLARHCELNHILDPRVPGSTIGPGRALKVPSVSRRWEKQSARAALLDLLKEHKLTLVMNRATSVARIGPENAGISPISTNAIGNEADAVVPLVEIKDMSLCDAIVYVARHSRLEASFDPRFTASKLAREKGAISFR